MPRTILKTYVNERNQLMQRRLVGHKGPFKITVDERVPSFDPNRIAPPRLPLLEARLATAVRRAVVTEFDLPLLTAPVEKAVLQSRKDALIARQTATALETVARAQQVLTRAFSNTAAIRAALHREVGTQAPQSLDKMTADVQRAVSEAMSKDGFFFVPDPKPILYFRNLLTGTTAHYGAMPRSPGELVRNLEALLQNALRPNLSQDFL